jgi:hypothetical protein
VVDEHAIAQQELRWPGGSRGFFVVEIRLVWDFDLVGKLVIGRELRELSEVLVLVEQVELVGLLVVIAVGVHEVELGCQVLFLVRDLALA